jgi:hypothetical protein
MSLSDWIGERRKQAKLLVFGEDLPPPPPPGARGAPPRKAPPPPKEPPLSPRRLLIGAEAAVLLWACWLLPGTWRAMLGGWPTRANFVPPRIESFTVVRGLRTEGRNLWITGPFDLNVVHVGQRLRPFERIHRKLPSPTVTAVLPSPEGTWIATARGLAIHDGRGVRKVRGRGAPGKLHMTCLARDARGRIWAGTARNGLWMLDGKVWRSFGKEVASPYVTALVPAGGGAVWVGLYAGGVVRTDGDKWTPCREPEALRGQPVRRLVPAGSDSVLALTGSGLSVVTTGGWRNVAPKGWPAGEKPADLVEVPGGKLIVVTSTGAMYDLDLARETVRPILPGHSVREAMCGASSRASWRR